MNLINRLFPAKSKEAQDLRGGVRPQAAQKILGKTSIAFFLLAMVANSFGEPMEPSRSTLYILVHGLDKNDQGLKMNSCQPDRGTGGKIWGGTGVLKFLDEEILNSAHGAYVQSFENPAGSPIDQAGELADRSRTIKNRTCSIKSVSTSYDPVSNKISQNLDLGNGSWAETNMFESAVENWFQNELTEAKIYEVHPNTGGTLIQKERSNNSWKYTSAGFQSPAEFSVLAANGDPRVSDWINQWHLDHNQIDPVLADLRKARPVLVPARYVLLAHDMGGLSVREYVQGPTYRGDVDKIVFYDTPHEGTGYADFSLFRGSAYSSLASKVGVGVDISRALAFSGVGYLTLKKEAPIKMVSNFLESNLIGIGVKSAVDAWILLKDDGMSVQDQGLWYLAQEATRTDPAYSDLQPRLGEPDFKRNFGRLAALNQTGMLSGWNVPSTRLFTTTGLPVVGNMRKLKMDWLFQEKVSNPFDFLPLLVDKRYGVPAAVTDEGLDYLNGLGDGLARNFKITHPPRVLNWFSPPLRRIAGILETVVPPSWNGALMSGFLKEMRPPESINDADVAEGADVIANSVAQASLNLIDRGTYRTPAYSSFGKNVQFLSGVRRIKYDMSAGRTESPVVQTILDANYPEFSQTNDLMENLTIIGDDNQAATAVRTTFEYGCVAQLYLNAAPGAVDLLNSAFQTVFWKVIAPPMAKVFDLFEDPREYDGGLDDGVAAVKSVESQVCGTIGMSLRIAHSAITAKKVVSYLDDIMENSSSTYSLAKSIRQNAEGKTDLEEMIFEPAFVTIPVIRATVAGQEKLIPQIFYEETEDVPENLDIRDIADIQRMFPDLLPSMDELANLDKDVVPVLFDPQILSGLDYGSPTWSRQLGFKESSYLEITDALASKDANNVDVRPMVRRVTRYAAPAFTVGKSIKEIRFQVDDVRPDLLQELKIDFNTKVTFKWVRSVAGWQASRKVGMEDWVNMGTLQTRGPVDAFGHFIFRPREWLGDLGPAAIQEDGPNVVTVMTTNKLGMMSNQRFSFLYTATAPIIYPNWPRDFQVVSSLKKFSINASNWGYPYSPTSASVSLFPATGIEPVITPENVAIGSSIDATLVGSSSGADWQKIWKIERDQTVPFLGSSNLLADGNYLLDWSVVMTPNTPQDQNLVNHLNTYLVYDTKAPQVEIIPSSTALLGTDKDGVWARVHILEASPDKSIRELRRFVTWSFAGKTDSLFLPPLHNYSFETSDVSWDGLDVSSIPQGVLTFRVEGFDYAAPDEATDISLSKLKNLVGLPLRTAWSALQDGEGNWIEGINGFSASANFFFDKTAPNLVENSWRLGNGVVNYSAMSSGVFWANDTQNIQIDLDLNEPLLGRPSEEVTLEYTFTNKTTSEEYRFVQIATLAPAADGTVNTHVTYVEPTSRRLPDGQFTMRIRLVDDAGNERSLAATKEVQVDRTLPQIAQVFTSALVYSAPSDIGPATAWVSQKDDIAPNRTDLTCGRRLWENGIAQAWQDMSALESRSKSGQDTVEVHYLPWVAGDPSVNGTWLTEFRCADAAGNVSHGRDVFSVGARYPVITEPTTEQARIVTEPMLVVRGIAANPSLELNDLNAEYRVRWRVEGGIEADWKDDGITLLQNSVAIIERNLALWDRSTLGTNDYEVQLSTRACTDASRVACAWQSTVQSVFLSALAESPVVAAPTLTVAPPTDLVPGGLPKAILTRLNGVSDGSTWKMDVRVLVPDPLVPAQKIEAVAHHVEKVSLSPFAGVPVGDLPDGVSMWQATNGDWTLRWKGPAEGTAPQIRISSLGNSLTWKEQPLAGVQQILPQVVDMSAVDASPYTEGKPIPYDRTKAWDCGNDMTWVFSASGPFMLDISSINGNESKQFWGINRMPGIPIGSGTMGLPILYVDPDRYASSFEWNGLTSSGIYPGGANAEISVVAVEDKVGGRVLTAKQSMTLLMGTPTLVTQETTPGVLNIGLAPLTNLQLATIGFDFGLAGRSANVTAKVLNPAGTVIKTLLSNVPTLAGSNPSAYRLVWNGVKDGEDDNTLETAPGTYKFQISAVTTNGVFSPILEYPFELKTVAGQIEAPFSSVAGEVSASLSMDEAQEDPESGDLRYLGNADYSIGADIVARWLPPEARTLKFHHGITGTQYPTYYPAHRFSVGVHRVRNRFPVTLLTLVATKGYNMNLEFHGPLGLTSGWYPGSEQVFWSIKLEKLFFSDVPASEDDFTFTKLYLKNSDGILGYNKDGDINYPIKTMVKILPASAYDELIKVDAPFEKATEFSGHGVANWDSFWSQCVTGVDCGGVGNNNILDKFSRAYDQVIYWEANPPDFKMDARLAEQGGVPKVDKKGCIPSDKNDPLSGGSSGTCGAKNAKEPTTAEINDFNPHKNMAAVKAIAFPEDYWTVPVGFSNSENSTEKIGVKVSVRVQSDYWNPPGFGLNNLANRYLRFDPTNQNLYGAEGYFAAKTQTGEYALNSNYFDGRVWRRSVNYGLATGFEAQRFSMLDQVENPLLFADEVNGEKVDSKFNIQMMPQSVPWKVLAKSVRDGYLPGGIRIAEPISASLVSTLGSATLGEWFNAKPMDFEIAVGMFASRAQASEVDNSISPSLGFPLDPSSAVSPLVHSAFRPLCSNDPIHGDFSTVVEGKKCFREYLGAARLHYFLGDWKEADWAPFYLAYWDAASPLRNPVSGSDLFSDAISWTKIAALDGAFLPHGSSGPSVTASTTLPADDSWYAGGKWTVPTSKLPTGLSAGDERLTGVDVAPPSLVLEGQAGATTPWVVDPVTKIVSNSGVVLTKPVSYVRSMDQEIPGIPSAALYPGGSENLDFGRLTAQSSSVAPIALNTPWVKDISVGHPLIHPRNNMVLPHPMFTLAKGEGSGVQVVRNAVLPKERLDETVTLRGRVPGANTPWSLQYLRNGVLELIASGSQATTPTVSPYPMLEQFNASMLQGNTSFFLTYGGAGINDNLYFRQLDVHVGKIVVPTVSSLVQSMFLDASVLFPVGAFPTMQDVTVRTVAPEDYNWQTFRGLAIIGPVIEVLPSHDFSQQPNTTWPRVKVRIPQASLEGINVAELRVYKPDGVHQEIRSLESQLLSFFTAEAVEASYSCSPGVEVCDPTKVPVAYAYVEVSGITSTFSEFVVMTTSTATNIKVTPNPTPGIDESAPFACGELPFATTLWLGLDNGYLQYPYTCNHQGNAVLQLRTGETPVSEYHLQTQASFRWAARASDVSNQTAPYGSRLAITDLYGNRNQLIGPSVRTDAHRPQIQGFSATLVDQHPAKVVEVNASMSDAESGISGVLAKFYFGGMLLESRTVAVGSALAEDFTIDPDRLAACLGCRAEVVLRVEDQGHNFVEERWASQPVFPLPGSLQLWYPLADGAGTVAHEATGSGLHLTVQASKPWLNGSSLYLGASSDNASVGRDWASGQEAGPFSLEFRYRPAILALGTLGALVSWQGSTPWTIGVRDGGIYFQSSVGSVVFANTLPAAKTDAHFVVVVNGRGVQLYRDGILRGTAQLPAAQQWLPVGRPVLGKTTSRNAILGNLSQVRLYVSALDDGDVDWAYTGGQPVDVSTVVIARASVLPLGAGLAVDQSCEVPGMAYVRQSSSTTAGTLNWVMSPGAGQYRLYLMAMALDPLQAKVEILLDGVSKGTFAIPADGVWSTVALADLVLQIPSGSHTLGVRPYGQTGIAGLAMAPVALDLPGSKIQWPGSSWTPSAPVVTVKIKYENFADKTWVRPQFQLTNTTSKSLAGVRLRYFYRGEGASQVASQSFTPWNATIGIHPDAGGVSYAEVALPDAIPANGQAYWGLGPKFGLYRAQNQPWVSEDDPSYQAEGAGGNLVTTDRVAVLDASGRLLNSWSCFESGGQAVSEPRVRVVAKDLKAGVNTASLIHAYVENTGTQSVNDFVMRYYFREAEGKLPETAVYSNPQSLSSFVTDGNGLYHMQFNYAGKILNPGEKTEYGSGLQFELHHPNWTPDWVVFDDPSHVGLTGNWLEASGFVVLDPWGNVLFGQIPGLAVASSPPVQAPSSPGILRWTRDGLVVHIASAGVYNLEVTNAPGIWQSTLRSGNWSVGDQVVNIPAGTISTGQYVVLRQGTIILDRILVP